MVTYLESKIVEAKRTITPHYGMCASGYTKRSGAPTSWMIRLDGEKRFRRVMVICFSNSGSIFIKMKGETVFVNEYDIPSAH